MDGIGRYKCIYFNFPPPFLSKNASSIFFLKNKCFRQILQYFLLQKKRPNLVGSGNISYADRLFVKKGYQTGDDVEWREASRATSPPHWILLQRQKGPPRLWRRRAHLLLEPRWKEAQLLHFSQRMRILLQQLPRQNINMICSLFLPARGLFCSARSALWERI